MALDLPAPVAAESAFPPVAAESAFPPVVIEPVASVEASNDELMQRVSNALAKVGIDPVTIKPLIVAKLEAAASAYENAVVSGDKDFWHAEAVRLTAALHAL